LSLVTRHKEIVMSRIRIIGLGNVLAGDDGVGILAARRLKARLEQPQADQAQVEVQVQVIEAELVGLEVLDLMEGADVVMLVDAARSGHPPGTLHRFEVSDGPIGKTLFPHSTHALNAVDALELGRTLGTLPPRVIVYGIEAGALRAGDALSPEVAGALEEVIERLAREVEQVAHA
jgi:hydrogenase maturation protease